MNLKAVVLALGLSLAQGAVLAAPVFIDDFLAAATRVIDNTTTGGRVIGDPVDVAPGVKRSISVNASSFLDSTAAVMSSNVPSAEVAAGYFFGSQGSFSVSSFGIHYSGSALDSLPNPFTGALLIRLFQNDGSPVTVTLSSDDPSAVIASTLLGNNGTPLTVTLTGAGNFGGDPNSASDGFSLIFQSSVAGFDISIDQISLVSAPATLAALAIGLLGIAGIGRRKFGS